VGTADFRIDSAFRDAADAIPASLCVFSPAGELSFANRFFCETTGWPVGDAREYDRIVHPADRTAVFAANEHAIATADPYRIELRLRDREGKYRTHVQTGAPLRGPDGSLRGLYAIAIDIEDHVCARGQLAESQRRFDTLVATVPQIVWTADASGRIEWYNDRWYAYTGQTPEEAAGWGWQAVHHPDDFPKVMEQWPTAIATGEMFEMEFRLLGREGYRWFLTRVVPLRDERGDVVRWFGSNTDIDDRKQSEQRLVEILHEVFRNEALPRIDPLRIDAMYLPAEPSALVGGDWYDALALGDGRCVISIGDVAGHGMEAASAAARLRQTVSAFAVEDPDPARVLERTNAVALAQRLAIATACVAVIDPETLDVAYATAGHPPPIFVSGSMSAKHGELGGVPLGVLPSVGARTKRFSLARDAHAIFYTDGLTEYARSPLEGERRLLVAADALFQAGPVDAARWVRERVVGAAAVPDDIAIVVVAAGPPRMRPPAEDERTVWRFHSSDPLTAQRSRLSIAQKLSIVAYPEPQALADSELIVGELLANTVEHAPGLVEVELEREGTQLVLTVSDSGPGLVARPSTLPAADSEDGRGLYLIRMLAREVSFGRTSRGGTLVRVVLPLEPGSNG
jgi:PAS domain S-box-containing protein